MATVSIMDLMGAVAMKCRQAPEPVLVEAYRRAARAFCSETRWLRVTIPGAPTEAGQSLYTLDGDPFHEVVGVRAVTAQADIGDRKAWPVHPSDRATWDPNRGPEKPRQFAYVPEAQLALFPTPDAVYQLTLTLALSPKRGATAIDEALLTKWDRALEAGALSYLLAIADMPWTDKAEAQMQERVFRAAINNARADEQRAHQAGTVLRRGTPFVVGTMR